MGKLGVAQIDSARAEMKQKQQQQQINAKQESVSFFDEAWSGDQIAKLTGDNFFTDWLQNKDKICTDGKDDGKLTGDQYALSFAKGLIGCVPKMIINHPLATAITAGLGAGAVALTSGAILPLLGAIGVATGVGMAGYGAYKAATAKTDGEAKQALETLGTGVFTTTVSMVSAGKALEKAAEAGVKSAQVSEDANIFQKTWQMFKSIPESITKSKEWVRYKYDMPISKEFNKIGAVTKKVYGEDTYRDYDIQLCRRNRPSNYMCVKEKTPDGIMKIYDNGFRRNLMEEHPAHGRFYIKYKYDDNKNKLIDEIVHTDGPIKNTNSYVVREPGKNYDLLDPTYESESSEYYTDYAGDLVRPGHRAWMYNDPDMRRGGYR